MQAISLVMLKRTETKVRNFCFTFIVCSSIINQNKIDFWSEMERERYESGTIRYFSWLASDINFRFERSKFSWLSKLMVEYTLFFSNTHYPNRTVEITLTSECSQTSHPIGIPILRKKSSPKFSNSPTWTAK